MELDLSTLLGGGGHSHNGISLNDEFSAVMPSGDNVFSKAFGDQTIFKTDVGTVTVSFVFNPRQRWSSKSILASVTADYMNEIRERMCDMLLKKEDIASREASVKEKEWRSILRNLPNKTLTSYIFSDKSKLDEFVGILSKTNEAENKEDKLLTEALKKREFRFSFEIGIDSFPAVDKNKHGREKVTKPSQTGTITFYFEGTHNKKNMTKAENLGHLMTDDPAKVQTQIKQNKTSPVNETRQLKKMTTKERKEIEEYNKLLTTLGLSNQEWKDATKETEKRMPLTASLFFDAVTGWFNCSVQTRSRNLQNQKDRSHLYQ